MHSVFAKIAVAALTFSSLGASSALLKVQTPAVGASVNTLQVVKQYVDVTNTAVRGDMDQLLAAINATASAQAELIEAIKADLEAVSSQFATAATGIASSTAGVVDTLTAPEVFALIDTLTTVQLLAASLLVQYNIAKARLVDSTLVATQAEFQAALSAIKPFSDPLLAYAGRVQQNGGALVGATAKALGVAVSATQQTVNVLLGSLGVQV